MATFLTTSKMDPALAARIDASVRGRRKRPGSTIAPRVVAVLRVAAFGAIVALVGWFVTTRSHERRDVEQARATLLDDVRQKSASLTRYDNECVTRATSWLVGFAASDEIDFVGEELRAPGAFDAILARPVVYVRGAIGAFSSTAGIVDAASASTKDPFVLCLAQPPSSRTEKLFLAKVRTAYAGGVPVESATENVRRLYDAIAGLPLLQPPWSARVQAAQEMSELEKLRRQLDRAPVEKAKQAAKAGLLLFAMDELGDGPTELDGERRHGVRVGLVDMTSSKVLLRLRKIVDPKWISIALRPEFSAGLDGCALAIDVHETIRAAH